MRWETLQLVEDLWDDLAVTPESVPVHDWQKEELARRKANLAKSGESGQRTIESARQALAFAEVRKDHGCVVHVPDESEVCPVAA